MCLLSIHFSLYLLTLYIARAAKEKISSTISGSSSFFLCCLSWHIAFPNNTSEMNCCKMSFSKYGAIKFYCFIRDSVTHVCEPRARNDFSIYVVYKRKKIKETKQKEYMEEAGLWWQRKIYIFLLVLLYMLAFVLFTLFIFFFSFQTRSTSTRNLRAVYTLQLRRWRRRCRLTPNQVVCVCKFWHIYNI